MNSKELERAAIDTVKLLQRKPMPYTWTKLAIDTHYSFEERRQIAAFLKTHGYVKGITPFAFILSDKGKQARHPRLKMVDMVMAGFATVVVTCVVALALIHSDDPGNVRVKVPTRLTDSVFVTR